MNPDFLTVFWKEWKEILPGRSASGASLRRPFMAVAFIGILLPVQMGAQTYYGPASLLFFTFISFAAVLVVIPDAFAGERERHTLETLLATRLPDHSILIGKLAACISYAWLLSVITVVVGFITVNAANWSGHVLFYRDAAWLYWLILLPPLVGSTVASAGIFISLHAATVRQAQQTLSFALVSVTLTIGFGMPSLRPWLTRNLAAWSGKEVVLAVSAVFLALDLVLVLAALKRFQRSKLVLD